jgi:hypothetical protein
MAIAEMIAAAPACEPGNCILPPALCTFQDSTLLPVQGNVKSLDFPKLASWHFASLSNETILEFQAYEKSAGLQTIRHDAQR